MGILDGLLQLGGDLLTSGLNYFSQGKTNAQNEALMRESWQRDDNAVQRRVADLKAAGLNPALAASGIGSPNSGAIRLGAPEVAPVDLSRTFAAMTGKSQVHQAEAAARAADSNASAAASNSSIAGIQADILRDQYNLRSDFAPSGISPLVWFPLQKQFADIQTANAMAAKVDADSEAAKAEASILKRTDRLNEKYQEAQTIMGLAGGGIGAAVNGLRGGLLLAPK